MYFTNHFYYGTEINGIDVSGMAVDKVDELMATELQKYTLELKERGGVTELIKADEVGLEYNSGGDFKTIKDKQNAFKWILSFFNKEASKIIEDVKFDNELLKQRIDQLSCFDSSRIIEPKNAGFQYTGNAFVILNEINGSKVNKDKLYPYVANALLKREAIVDLESIDCYANPEYTSKSQKVVEARDILNKYVSSKITYTFGENQEVLDGSTINKWLTVDENYVVTFQEDQVKAYVDVLADNHYTVGKANGFVTSSGKAISISKGDYGWSIDRAKETQALLSAIKEGQTITKEPAYSQTAFAHNNGGIGNTYVEIDLTGQYLWLYKEGALIAEGDIVTGNVSAGHTTPPGIYKLKYKQKNAVLRGPGYAAPVTFWMPFNGGIGIHDASWRNKFGGDIYKIDGSHGCVNSPYNLAKTIFENIEVGTPVVCYN